MLYLRLFCFIFVFFNVIIISNKSFSGLWEYSVHINDNTTNFNNARNNAIQYNRKIALENVIDKLINISDFKIVEKLIDNDNAYFFEEKLRLLNENTNNNVYTVDITYFFNKNKILSFLKKNGIPYTTQLNNRALFIPIMQNDDLIYNTKWYNLFKINAENYLTKIILVDSKLLNKDKILQKDKEYFLELQKKYNVKDIFIAIVNPILQHKNTEDKDNLLVNDAIPEESYSLTVINFSNNNYQSFDNLHSLQEAFKYTIGVSEIAVKNNILSSQDVKNTKIFKVVYNSFIDWVAIYTYLKQIVQIENVYLSELNERYCIIKIKYHGNLDDIVNIALNRNIIIDTSELTITCKGFCY